MSDDEAVSFNLDKQTLLEILKRAAAKERTVVEFRTQESGNERELSHIMDITDHVEQLEEETGLSP